MAEFTELMSLTSQIDRYTESIPKFEAFLEKFPLTDSAESYMILTEVHFYLGALLWQSPTGVSKKAIFHAQEAHRLAREGRANPGADFKLKNTLADKQIRASILLAKLAQSQNDNAGALKPLVEALGLARADKHVVREAELTLMVGKIYKDQLKLKQAEAKVREAMQKISNFSSNHDGRQQKGLAIYQECFLILEEILSLKGQGQAAKKVRDEAVEKLPDKAVELKSVRAMIQDGDYANAIVEVESWLQSQIAQHGTKSHELGEPLWMLGVCQARLNRRAEAEASFKKSEECLRRWPQGDQSDRMCALISLSQLKEAMAAHLLDDRAAADALRESLQMRIQGPEGNHQLAMHLLGKHLYRSALYPTLTTNICPQMMMMTMMMMVVAQDGRVPRGGAVPGGEHQVPRGRSRGAHGRRLLRSPAPRPDAKLFPSPPYAPPRAPRLVDVAEQVRVLWHRTAAHAACARDRRRG